MSSLTVESRHVQRSARRASTTSPLSEGEDVVLARSQRVHPEISPLQQQVDRAAQLVAIVANSPCTAHDRPLSNRLLLCGSRSSSRS